MVRENGEEASKLREEVDVRPRNWLIPSLLLMLRGSSSYGYELMGKLATLGFEAINITNVYRALRQMEEKGMVRSSWETSGDGPARRVYSVTEAGEAYLESWMYPLEQHQKMIETFFRAYANVKSESPRAPAEDHGKVVKIGAL